MSLPPAYAVESGRSAAATVTRSRSPSARSCTIASTPSASILGCRRTGSRRTCRPCSPSTPRRWGPAGRSFVGSILTPIGPVDLLCRDTAGDYVIVEVKRRGDIDGVEQLTRYLELLRRDHVPRVRGVFAAQQIKPQAKVLAGDRGIACLTLDYDALRGLDDPTSRLF